MAMPSKETIAKAFKKLKTIASRNHGVLPTRTRLNKMGLFYQYDVVRKAGRLGSFKRAFAR